MTEKAANKRKAIFIKYVALYYKRPMKILNG